MIIEINVFIVARENPSIKNVTFLQLITLFSNSLSNCSLSKVFNSNEDLQINDSSIKPRSIPTWYIDKIVDNKKIIPIIKNVIFLKFLKIKERIVINIAAK